MPGSAIRGRIRRSTHACHSVGAGRRKGRNQGLGAGAVLYDRSTVTPHKNGRPPMDSRNGPRVPEALKRRWPDIRPEDKAAVMGVLDREILGGVGAPESVA